MQAKDQSGKKTVRITSHVQHSGIKNRDGHGNEATERSNPRTTGNGVPELDSSASNATACAPLRGQSEVHDTEAPVTDSNKSVKPPNSPVADEDTDCADDMVNRNNTPAPASAGVQKHKHHDDDAPECQDKMTTDDDNENQKCFGAEPGKSKDLAAIAFETAQEYQRKVARGELKAPTDDDRANYQRWKDNYVAAQAKQQREQEQIQ